MSEGDNRLMQMSDDDLVVAARNGEVEAFERLLERHGPLLLAVCRSVAGPDLAEDAAQEASLRAMLRLHTLEHPDRFGQWLAGIGANICRAWLRSHTREVPGLSVLEQVTSTVTDPETHAMETDLADRIRGAVNRLPDGQRSAVRLFYLSGLSYAETANALGIQPGSVRTRLYKARATLRCQLRYVAEEEHMTETQNRICSFCNKPREEVRRMIAGPKGVVICNECIDLCNKIIAEEEAKAAQA